MPEPFKTLPELDPQWTQIYRVIGEIVRIFATNIPYYAYEWRSQYQTAQQRAREYSDPLWLNGRGFDLAFFASRQALSITPQAKLIREPTNPYCVIFESVHQPPNRLDRFLFYGHSREWVSKLQQGLDLDVSYNPLTLTIPV